MRVLVCGGRNYKNWRALYRTLDNLSNVTTIIEGGATGADRLARGWAHSRLTPVETYEADWATHANAAGPIRNSRMLEEGKPDLVVAFDGGAGTADMVRKAERAGVRVIKV